MYPGPKIIKIVEDFQTRALWEESIVSRYDDG
jgi:hypothetical protein